MRRKGGVGFLAKEGSGQSNDDGDQEQKQVQDFGGD